MLEKLSLWNIGGIRRAELCLSRGLTVITGESGAGKSSIVRALELIGGERAQVSLLRAGEDEGGAEGTFSATTLLPELDPSLQPEDGRLFARRILSRKDRAKASLQGIQTPLATYSLAVAPLLHIQSQFAQMELLEPDRQLSMVDSCTPKEIRSLADELRRTFEKARDCDRELKAAMKRRGEIEQRYANAGEVLSLVRRVAPEPGLESRLETAISELSQRIGSRERARMNLDLLTGGLSESGLLDSVKNAAESLLEFLPEDERPPAQGALIDSLHSLSSLAETAASRLEGQESDLEERERLETRLGALRRLRRLSGADSEEELLTYCDDARENLEWLETNYPELERLNKESLDLKKKANALAMELRTGRQKAAQALQKRVNSLLLDLAMDTALFEIHFRELGKLRRSGADEVEFCLRTGERVGRVDKIASGGELSRLLLALQLSLPDEWLPPTLVFDEVEAGLGGRAAVLSGMKLKELSRRCQVLLVTHEASIAALGNLHILVRREGGETAVTPIEGEERVREIARMLSGSPYLSEAQDHARTLLEQR